MKAYEELTAEGLVTATKGKGYFVNSQDEKMLAEQHMRQVEESLTEAINSARIAGLDVEELCETLRTLWEMEN
jgi:GntR family transcriptional regulator